MTSDYNFFFLKQQFFSLKSEKKKRDTLKPFVAPAVETMNAPPQEQLEKGQGISNRSSYLKVG